MIVYAADKKQFLHHTDHDDIENVILTSFKTVTGKGRSNRQGRHCRPISGRRTERGRPPFLPSLVIRFIA